jgi:hypothetical protein
MSAGSGADGRSLERNQAARPAGGERRTTAPDPATVGNEQHEQLWQFGGH